MPSYQAFLDLFSDIQKMVFSGLVLSMIFCMGEALPYQYYGQYFVIQKNIENINILLLLQELFDEDSSRCQRVSLSFFSDHLNETFINFLLDGIEAPPAGEGADQIPDTFFKLILAFNLHFELPEDNIVMKVLAKRGTAKIFTEKLMLMVNREGNSNYCKSLYL